MKINEIISEAKGKFRKGAEYALSNVQSYPYLDNNNHPYLAYRFGMALATSPNTVNHTEGPIGSEFTTIAYSDADKEIIDAAQSQFGIDKRVLSTQGSKEIPTVSVNSPVAKRKKNKYGV